MIRAHAHCWVSCFRVMRHKIAVGCCVGAASTAVGVWEVKGLHAGFEQALLS